MSKKNFEEWKKYRNDECNRTASLGCYGRCYECEFDSSTKSAWNFCASQYEREVEGLKLKFSEATNLFSIHVDHRYDCQVYWA